MNALSTRNDSPETASRPFSASRDGFVMGEGAACLVLEEMEHALARGAKIYCEIAGTGMSADAYHLTASHPDGLGAKLVMRNALEDAEMTPEDIDYINVHAGRRYLRSKSDQGSFRRSRLQPEYQFDEINDRTPLGSGRSDRGNVLH